MSDIDKYDRFADEQFEDEDNDEPYDITDEEYDEYYRNVLAPQLRTLNRR